MSEQSGADWAETMRRMSEICGREVDPKEDVQDTVVDALWALHQRLEALEDSHTRLIRETGHAGTFAAFGWWPRPPRAE